MHIAVLIVIFRVNLDRSIVPFVEKVTDAEVLYDWIPFCHPLAVILPSFIH